MLYGVGAPHGKEAGGRAEGSGRFTYQGDEPAPRPGAVRAGRVNSGPGVDARGVTGGNPKGDTRTYPEDPSGAPSGLLRGVQPGLLRSQAPDPKAAVPCVSTSP
ncbi:hypothetical protein DVZ84_27965 [Streptomyces parvulus]|uniref:Uncharacterized protein n=1 Tax=Streptomyces parvulus TaxID=146923 RepID=A0A369UZ87_9ACTN|nr:hypothetical protein DVZ84_27965 [Streptomyces parvulus]